MDLNYLCQVWQVVTSVVGMCWVLVGRHQDIISINCWLSDQVLCFCFVLTVMKTKLINASKGIVLAIISVSVFSPAAGVCSHVLVSPSSRALPPAGQTSILQRSETTSAAADVSWSSELLTNRRSMSQRLMWCFSALQDTDLSSAQRHTSGSQNTFDSTCSGKILVISAGFTQILKVS